MSAVGTAILRGHKLLRKQLGNQTFTWEGNNYVCVPNTAQAGASFDLGGFALTADLTIFVEYASLPSSNLPVATKTITFKGKKYRIDNASLIPGDTVYRLICNDPNKK